MIFTYLRRRAMVYLTWRLMDLNRLLDGWTKAAREQAVVNRASYVVEKERTKVLRDRLTAPKE